MRRIPSSARFFQLTGLASLLFCASLLVSGGAFADVVTATPPSGCPSGTEPRASHLGAYCEPKERKDCPPGYEPRVVRDVSYCEAPPKEPCPPGSYWTSDGPSKGSCRDIESCNDCGVDECKVFALCIGTTTKRNVGPEVFGPCKTNDDCKAFPGARCAERPRCLMRASTEAQKLRIEQAKGVNPESVPAPYTANPGGPRPPGCGCGVAGAEPTRMGGVAGMIVVGAIVRRRRRRAGKVNGYWI